MIPLLLLVLVCAIVYWGGHRIIEAFGAPQPVSVGLDVVIVIYFISRLLKMFGYSLDF